MRRFIVLIMCAAFSVVAYGQVQEPVFLGEIKVTPPRFAGIDDVGPLLERMESQSMGDYVIEHFRYPEGQGVNVYEGTEIVQFKVLPNGELADFKVLNSVSPQVDAEVIRVLKSTNGMWVPGTSDGKPVSMKSEFSLVVKLGTSEADALEKDFLGIARSNFTKACVRLFDQGKPKRALKYFDRGIRYRPNDKALLYMRGLCLYGLGNEAGARADWRRLKDLGGLDFESVHFTDGTHEMKGYSEMVDILKEKE